MFLQELEQGDAVHARQADIQEDQIPFLPGEHA